MLKSQTQNPDGRKGAVGILLLGDWENPPRHDRRDRDLGDKLIGGLRDSFVDDGDFTGKAPRLQALSG